MFQRKMCEDEDTIHTFLQAVQPQVACEWFVGDIVDSGIEPEEYALDWSLCDQLKLKRSVTVDASGGAHDCAESCLGDRRGALVMNCAIIDKAELDARKDGCDSERQKGGRRLRGRAKKQGHVKHMGGNDVVSCDTACHVLISTPELRLRNTGVG